MNQAFDRFPGYETYALGPLNLGALMEKAVEKAEKEAAKCYPEGQERAALTAKLTARYYRQAARP